MGGNSAQLAYVIVYVPDVNKAAEFYQKAFNLEIRPQNKTNSWVEMETGAVTLAFTPLKQRETQLIGGVAPPNAGNNRVDICLNFPDVDAAYEHAISVGASPVADPEDKVWEQKVCYVKDLNENIVRLGSFVGK
ncbi:hypothetical protein KC19_11G161700 [Ceratodon purpureus]|uniref:VOC domain-containing protein n=1 Tax=Ceratodon purpureus TaxID=3225 RepID=A0A8T0GF09_CERPU|nr:hypothetical protein KC19_11G161700 [Ceratodon purpureus]